MLAVIVSTMLSLFAEQMVQAVAALAAIANQEAGRVQHAPVRTCSIPKVLKVMFSIVLFLPVAVGTAADTEIEGKAVGSEAGTALAAFGMLSTFACFFVFYFTGKVEKDEKPKKEERTERGKVQKKKRQGWRKRHHARVERKTAGMTLKRKKKDDSKKRNSGRETRR